MPKGEFNKGCQRLLKIVGDKKLEGKVVVDQVYAKFQHESLDLKHPHGGGGKFLTRALFKEHRGIMRGLARDAYQVYGLNSAMIVGMERVVRGVYQNAPHEFNDLRNSGAPSVKDRGRFIYNRPPVVKRLTKSQLRAKDRARGRR
jgi:hypothetical protein